jgi:FdhD protein
VKLKGSSSSRAVTRYEAACFTTSDDSLAIEEPLEIRLGGEPLSITMRTPGHDTELAAGFCYTEGLIHDPDDLESVEACGEATFGNVVLVKLGEEAMAQRAAKIQSARREIYMSSSCGLCGKQSLDRIEQEISPIRGAFTVSRGVLDSLPGTMRQAQATFEQTGGLHAAGLFTPAGELRVVREDVGRHNAVDKVVGWGVLTRQTPLDRAVLLVSGRASFEIMQKAAMAGIAMVCAVSAPSSLAVDFAVRMGMTLVGFLRPGRMNVYHDRGRIVE